MDDIKNQKKDAFDLLFTIQMTLTILRILIGWHFLYEGLAKLFNPNWSAAGYLLESSWFLSGFFHSIASNTTILSFVDVSNIWGLILIGLGLFFGCFTRIASAAGILLLSLYYIVNPPFIGYSGQMSAEGSYLIINKNFIEICALLIFALIKGRSLFGLDRFSGKSKPTKEKIERVQLKVPADENSIEKSFMNRREIIKNLAALPVFGVFVLSVLKKKSYEERRLKNAKGIDAVTSASTRAAVFASLKDLNAPVPRGKIGEVEISRIICGGNLISGFSHARDLIYVSPFIKRYHTDDKVIETLRLCEACGINTAILRTDDHTIRILNKYWKRGGKIQWLAQTYPKEENSFVNIQKAIDNGAIGAFVQGGIADLLVKNNKINLLEKTISFIRENGLIAGTAGHSLQVPMTCEKEGIEVDFYMKTFHRDDYWSAHPRDKRKDFSVVGENKPDHNEYHDNIWCIYPEETAEFMEKVNKPWIAYKVLAAGAIHPKDGLKYIFENGADFACIGMFDFQIVENANIVLKVLNDNLQRKRPWRT